MTDQVIGSQAAAVPPHGYCECASGIVSLGCCGGLGPAAFEVTRGGKQVKLCTRCDLSRDEPTRKTLVQPGESLAIYVDFDVLGAWCLVNPPTHKAIETVSS